MLLSQNNYLLEAPFEQTHFQADIHSMEETVMQCKQMTDEIYKSLKVNPSHFCYDAMTVIWIIPDSTK